MHKTVLVAAALTIIWLSDVALGPALTGNAATNALAAAQPEGAAASGGTISAPPVKPGNYVVRTVWKNAPLSTVRVEWRRRIEDAAPAFVGDTVRIGTAIFRPESGTYYLTAQWRPDNNFARPLRPGDRFAWYGRNPLTISSEISETLTLMLEEVPPPASFPPPAGTGVFGRVTLEGAPVADAAVFAYAKTGTGLKADDFQATVRTNAKGEFVLELPPDRYFLLARLRADHGVYIGPLHKGDLLGYDPVNPIVVEKGRYAASAIPMTKLRMDKSRAESSAFLPGTIEGRIIDRDRRPVPGVYAALYQNANLVGRPDFMSNTTGADGRFTLYVPVPGSFFLGARSGYGIPDAGARFGTWGGSVDHSISIKSGEVRSGIEIVVERLLQKMAPPENSGAPAQGTSGHK